MREKTTFEIDFAFERAKISSAHFISVGNELVRIVLLHQIRRMLSPRDCEGGA